MNIVLISRGYPDATYKMNGIFEMDQAKALQAYGHKVTLLSIDVRSLRRWRKWGLRRLTVDGIDVYSYNVPLGRVPLAFRRRVMEKMMLRGYAEIEKDQGRQDLLHAHFSKVGQPAVALKKRTHLPLVLTEHWSSLMHGTLSQEDRKMVQEAYEGADELIAVSKSLQQVIKESFGKEARLIHDVVDTDLFQIVNNEKFRTPFRFVCVGSLIPRKGMVETVKAFAEAFKGNENVELQIIGEGPERKNLEEIIKAEGLEDQVSLHGLIDRREIADRFQESHCFVLASKAETFGVVFIEAMAAGLPVIATVCGGPENFVTAECGLLLADWEIADLARAMKNIVEGYDAYDLKKIRDYAKEHFSSYAIAEALTKVYRRIVKNPDGRDES